MKLTYQEKAELLCESKFWMAGQGHFNITTEEIALVLKMLNEGDRIGLKQLYDKLSKERLG